MSDTGGDDGGTEAPEADVDALICGASPAEAVADASSMKGEGWKGGVSVGALGEDHHAGAADVDRKAETGLEEKGRCADVREAALLRLGARQSE